MHNVLGRNVECRAGRFKIKTVFRTQVSMINNLIKYIAHSAKTILISLTIVLAIFSFYVSRQLFISKQNLVVMETELAKLKANPPTDPTIGYVYNLQKYDSIGSKPLSYKCYEPEKPKNMSEKDQYWYDAGSHYPPYPTDNAEINIIQQELKKNNKPFPSKICQSPVSNDYLVVTNTADMYRFDKNLSYGVYTVSDKFTWFDIVSWLENGDLVYSPGGGGFSMVVYVFTNKNEDILLEYCENMPIPDNDENFICKNFNIMSGKSNYVPNPLLYNHLMPSRW